MLLFEDHGGERLKLVGGQLGDHVSGRPPEGFEGLGRIRSVVAEAARQ
jgi:hypothetical protein